MNLIGFDLEISKALDDTQDFWAQTPFGISCAVTIEAHDGDEADAQYWAGYEPGRCTAKMTPQGVDNLIVELYAATREGYYVVTLNGAGFDLRVLAQEAHPEMFELVKYVALRHIDIGLCSVAEQGYMVGLKRACEGMGVVGKMEGMDGSKAPVLWQGSREDQDKVLAYCEQDVQATLNLYNAIVERGYMKWVSKAGKLNVWHPTFEQDEDGTNRRMLTVAECLELPEPNTSWMSEPRLRSSYVEWMFPHGK